MFDSELLDRLSRVHPTVPLFIFIPAIAVLFGLGQQNTPALQAIGLLLGGYAFWTLTEYWMHRVVFHFEPEDGLVGAQEFIASGNGDGLDWISTTGVTLAAGHIYYATSAGALQSIGFANGVPVPGTQATVAASGFAGTHGLFLGS